MDMHERAWGLETTHESGCFVGTRVRCPGLAVSGLDRPRAFTAGSADTWRILQTNNVMVEPLFAGPRRTDLRQRPKERWQVTSSYHVSLREASFRRWPDFDESGRDY